MKRLCVCLCCLLLLLTACGRPASIATTAPTEAVSALSEPILPQTQTESGLTESASALPPTESLTETQTEPITTAPQRETPPEPTATTAEATQRGTQTTRETHTLFTTPPRTTGARTTAARTTTTRSTTTTTTRATTTTTTTTASGGYTPSVQPVRKTCTVTIDCRELRDHPEKLKQAEKAAFVPKNGYIVQNVTMEFKDGESVYDVLRAVCKTHTCTDNCRFCQAEGIQMESSYSPQFDSYYVEGIHQLYEKDCGGTSGWTYYVNGWFPNYGSSEYIVKPGDRIEWVYSIALDNEQEKELT